MLTVVTARIFNLIIFHCVNYTVSYSVMMLFIYHSVSRRVNYTVYYLVRAIECVICKCVQYENMSVVVITTSIMMMMTVSLIQPQLCYQQILCSDIKQSV